MKGQTLLTTLYCLLFSSSGNQIKEDKDKTGIRQVREHQTNTIYHNGQPLQVHGIPQSPPHNNLQTLATESVPNKLESGPKVALQRDKVVIQNENSYLQDSYGNRFHNLPQQVSFKTTFPQQYVALQDLPLHFSQSLPSPNGNKQSYTLPHSAFQEQYNRPSFHQGPSQSVFYDFSKAPQSAPVLLKQAQHHNVPNQGHYKTENSGPISLNNQPVTFSFHTHPSQRFVNFAPERLQQSVQAESPFSYNTRPFGMFLNQKVIFDKPVHFTRPSPNAPAKSARLQDAKKDESERVIKISEQVKTIDPQYFKPQVFLNPIVPQVQHFLPHILNVHKIRNNPAQIVLEPKNQTPQKHQKHQSQNQQQNLPQVPQKHQHQEDPVQRQIKQFIQKPEYDTENKRVIINEYTAPPKHEHKEETKSEVIKEEENNEKNFDEGYHEAAKGFPTYSINDDYEKKIYDEGSYGEPVYHDALPFGPPDDDESNNPAKIVSTIHHNEYDSDKDYNKKEQFKAIPYYSDGNKFYSSNKPSGQYTKHYDGPKYSSKTLQHEHEFPSNFGDSHVHSGDHAHFHNSPLDSGRYEVDYSKRLTIPLSDSRRHSSFSPGSHGDSPTSRFVEPQYQYGFEPIFTRVASDEPSVSASNIAPETEERPNSMKKIYKENWFISKTSSSDAGSGDS